LLFTSEVFLFLFFPLALIASKLGELTQSSTCRMVILLIASLVFYSSWDWRFTPLLLASIAFNYFISGYIQKRDDETRRVLLIVAIACNLALLIFYKYVDLLIVSIGAVLDQQFQLLKLVLPLGISFFTFTQLAFLVDVYKRRASRGSWLEYSVFVSYFPHAIAGPLLNYRHFIPQLQGKLSINQDNLHAGMSIFAVGLAKKILVADTFAGPADRFFAQVNAGVTPQLIEAWTGVLAYTFQLYFDFSGYSDMAVGLSRCFGIYIPHNFRSPYLATNISDFWKRWHISLSDFLKHYLYIPLGGNQVSLVRNGFNILLTMGLGGIWHGANWTFLAWGLLHGLFLLIHKLWRKATSAVPLLCALSPKPVGAVLTFLAVVLAWVFFRAPTVEQALLIIEAISGENGIESISPDSGLQLNFLMGTFLYLWESINMVETVVLLPVLAGFLTCFTLPSTQEFFEKSARGWKILEYPSPLVSWIHGLLLGICALKVLNRDPTVFLYFQF
jgi:alginate O-acetyltransferase complex protein AlgI